MNVEELYRALGANYIETKKKNGYRKDDRQVCHQVP